MKRTKYNFDSEIYKPEQIKDILKTAVSEKDLKGNNKGIYYYNIPCAFDIETTSFYRDSTGNTFDYKTRLKLPKNEEVEKLAIMYVWQFGINGNIFVGRTWNEFKNLMEIISTELKLNGNRRLIIFVHNLGFEFQFMRKLFVWEKVFSIDLRKPIYTITNTGLEFRCSYLLSGYSLENVAKNLTRYKVKKMVGDLDYSLIRNQETEISDSEMLYCVNDVKIVMLYILELIENVKSVHNFPLTKTGNVRKFCRKNCFFVNTDEYKGKNYKYKDLMQDLKIRDLTEFKLLLRAFSGGFTHANANYTDKIIYDVSSYDFTSSYPYVMISEKFPLSKGVKITIKSEEQFNYFVQNYLCVFDVEFINIFSRETENIISVSKCLIKENAVENNGRLVCAERIVTTITNVDWFSLKMFYTWEHVSFGYFYAYKKEYLPTDFVKCIVELYKKKTELKGVQGMETEYLNSKEMLNSCYGMCVTNPLREEIIYSDSDTWETKEPTEEEKFKMLMEHNESENRFLYYIWGVFVTAYARRNLFTAIYELKNDYVYSDTDSVKFINLENHKTYFQVYNNQVEKKLQTACNYHGIPFADLKPKTIKGKEKLLGVWDFEGTYKRFKTLGAKRYMIEKENALTANGKQYNFSLTVSGVNKLVAIPYLLETYGENGIFDAFTNYLHLPPKATGKNILTYIDYETTGTLTDYQGHTAQFNELSGVHLEPTDYHLNLSVLYLKYLNGIKFS